MNEFKTEEQWYFIAYKDIYYIIINIKNYFKCWYLGFRFSCVKLPEMTDMPLNRPKVPPIDAI